MENKNIIYNKTDDTMNVSQAKKELLEKMKQEALDAAQRNGEFQQQMKHDALDAAQRREELYQQIQEDMLKETPILDIPEAYIVNEFGEIERPDKSRKI